jgi:hypothetical protein
VIETLCPEASIRSARQSRDLSLPFSSPSPPPSASSHLFCTYCTWEQSREDQRVLFVVATGSLTADTVIDSLSVFRDSRPGLGLSVGYPHAQTPKTQAKSRLTEHRPRFHRHSCSPSNDPITPNASLFVLPPSYCPAVTCDS